MSSKLQADRCYHYQWWRRLVNAYEVNAGVVYLQRKNGAPCLSASEASFSKWGAIQIQLPLPFPFT